MKRTQCMLAVMAAVMMAANAKGVMLRHVVTEQLPSWEGVLIAQADDLPEAIDAEETSEAGAEDLDAARAAMNAENDNDPYLTDEDQDALLDTGANAVVEKEIAAERAGDAAAGASAEEVAADQGSSTDENEDTMSGSSSAAEGGVSRRPTEGEETSEGETASEASGEVASDSEATPADEETASTEGEASGEESTEGEDTMSGSSSAAEGGVSRRPTEGEATPASAAGGALVRIEVYSRRGSPYISMGDVSLLPGFFYWAHDGKHKNGYAVVMYPADGMSGSSSDAEGVVSRRQSGGVKCIYSKTFDSVEAASQEIQGPGTEFSGLITYKKAVEAMLDMLQLPPYQEEEAAPAEATDDEGEATSDEEATPADENAGDDDTGDEGDDMEGENE